VFDLPVKLVSDQEMRNSEELREKVAGKGELIRVREYNEKYQ